MNLWLASSFAKDILPHLQTTILASDPVFVCFMPMSGALCIPTQDTPNEYWTSQVAQSTDISSISVHEDFMCLNLSLLTARYKMDLACDAVSGRVGFRTRMSGWVGGFFHVFPFCVRVAATYHREIVSTRWGSWWCPGWIWLIPLSELGIDGLMDWWIAKSDAVLSSSSRFLGMC